MKLAGGGTLTFVDDLALVVFKVGEMIGLVSPKLPVEDDQERDPTMIETDLQSPYPPVPALANYGELPTPPVSWKAIANVAIMFISLVVVPLGIWFLEDMSRRITAVENRVTAVETSYQSYRELGAERMRHLERDINDIKFDLREIKKTLLRPAVPGNGTSR